MGSRRASYAVWPDRRRAFHQPGEYKEAMWCGGQTENIGLQEDAIGTAAVISIGQGKRYTVRPWRSMNKIFLSQSAVKRFCIVTVYHIW